MVFGVFSSGRTQCIAPKKLPDKAMSIWNLHKKFQLSSAMGLRDFDLQSQATLMGGNPLIVVHCGDDDRFIPLIHWYVSAAVYWCFTWQSFGYIIILVLLTELI